jgi:hypothetical protein
MKLPFLPLLFITLLGHLHAAERVALVVGISDYPQGSALEDLPCAKKDAELVGKALQDCGFDVLYSLNEDKERLDAKIDQFFQKISPGGDAVFYFAGHGMQWQEKNYLMGSNARLQAKYRLGEEAIEAQTVLGAMSERKPGNALAFLDCCRTPPQASWLTSDSVPRSQRREGLAAMQYSSVLVNFAAAASQSALEPVGGEHGLYAMELEKGIRSGEELSRMLKDVTREVVAASRKLTGNAYEQRPYLSGSLVNDFWFRKCGGSVSPPAGGSTDLTRQAQWQEYMKKMEADYAAAEKLGTTEAWQVFLAAYGKAANPYSDRDEVMLAMARKGGDKPKIGPTSAGKESRFENSSQNASRQEARTQNPNKSTPSSDNVQAAPSKSIHPSRKASKSDIGNQNRNEDEEIDLLDKFMNQ